jgi:hypothetical protein
MSSLMRMALLLVIPFLTSVSVFGQQVVGVQPEGVAKARGWVMPDLYNFRDRERVPVMPVSAEGKRTLYATEIDLPEDGRILLEDAAYYRAENGRRDLIESPIAARSITRLDVDGKVFAYIAYGAGVAITKSRRRPTVSTIITLGCLMGYAYYDLDGDGKFELLARSDRLPGAKIFIPAWVLRDAKRASR